MKKKEKISFRAIICFAITTVCIHISHIYVFAMDINVNEQHVIDVLSEIFEIEDKAYKVHPILITEAENYLLSEDIDLTKEQSERLIQYISNNLQTAVYEGYLILAEPQGAIPDGETTLGKEVTLDKEITLDKEVTSDKLNMNSDEGTGGNNSSVEDDDNTKGYDEDNVFNKILDQLESNIESNSENESDINETNNMQNPDIANKIDDTQNPDMMSKSGETSDINNQDMTNIENNVQNQDMIDEHTSRLAEKVGNNNVSNMEQKIIHICVIVSVLVIITVVILRIYISSRIAKSNKNQEHSKGYIDIHAHILPGVDDGPCNMEETVEMLKLAYEQGIRTIIATPHYHINRKTTPARLKDIADEVQKEAKKIDEDFCILLGNEIFYEEGCLEALKLNKACTMAGSRYILVEFPLDEDFHSMYAGMRELIMEGYCPVIAHAERYRCLYKKNDRLLSLIELGCYIQVNAGSIHRRVKKMIAENLVHFIASDCHDVHKRKPNIEDSLSILRKTMDESVISKMVILNPSKIIKKIYI